MANVLAMPPPTPSDELIAYYVIAFAFPSTFNYGGPTRVALAADIIGALRSARGALGAQHGSADELLFERVRAAIDADRARGAA